ncbi:MAG: ACP S-malonyltransferase [Desulfobacterales bacterium]|nr:ACP S-malonyltransferase [Desulfobacterales bacterium]
MDNQIVFMFSGQGSQFFQMGNELYESHPIFQKWMKKLDAVCLDINGTSIIDKIFDKTKKKSDLFDNTLHTHPAIFMVEYALAKTLIEEGIEPDYVLGSSLGEFASAALSNAITFEKAIESIIKQAEILEFRCKKGGMAAILYDSNLYYESKILHENSQIAAINFQSHFVVSGRIEKLDLIENFLRERNITYMRIPVSLPFHSSFIDDAENDYKAYLSEQTYKKPEIPMISCISASIIDTIDKNYFWNVVRQPILFEKTIKELYKKNKFIYIDLGPSGTSSVFVKYNLEKILEPKCFNIITPFGNDLKNLEKLKGEVQKDYSIHKKSLNKQIKEDHKMLTFVFPGQGSQKKGMGGVLFDDFKDLTSIADEILGYSIKTLCMEDPENKLGQTQYTQPALYVVNALSYLKKVNETETLPNYVAGHSLGEYDALFASGIFSFETGLKLVQKRGALMSQAKGGGMAAVIGLSQEKIETILKENNLTTIQAANYNSPHQIVISGLKEDVLKAQPIFEQAGAKLYIPLNVSGAFHTVYMEPAKIEFTEFIQTLEFSNTISIPVISNVYARPYKPNKIKETLSQQITSPVRWTEIICYLLGRGEMQFEEIGPGKVLTGLIAKIKIEAQPIFLDEELEEIDETTELEKQEEKMEEPISLALDSESVPEKIPAEAKEDEILKEQKTINLDDLPQITAKSLGSDEYKKEYNLKYAYVAGAMYKAIASKELVVKMGKANLMAYFGTGGISLSEIEDAIKYIQKELGDKYSYGMNLLHHPMSPETEEKTVDLFLKYGVKNVEAAAFMQMTPALVKYRLKGLKLGSDGSIICENRIQGKLSRPEVAQAFLTPAPERIVKKLLEENKITSIEADLSQKIPMAYDVCVESDSGGHTDQGIPYVLMPAMIKLRDEMMQKYNYPKKIRVGAAGGIGSPEAAAAAFMLGADFIVTGSINQCTVEAGTSDSAKDLLQQINVQDTDYAPAGDMFEMGAKVQVLKKGLFFPARANKLYSLYQQYNSIDEIDEKTKKQIQEKYFKKNFEDIYAETKEFFKNTPDIIEKAEKNPKYKMALIFRWYFGYSTRIALSGDESNKVDYQIHCGPALGAFNQWVKGTDLENWKNRHVDEIGTLLMEETAKLLNQRLKEMLKIL